MSRLSGVSLPEPFDLLELSLDLLLKCLNLALMVVLNLSLPLCNLMQTFLDLCFHFVYLKGLLEVGGRTYSTLLMRV